MGIAVDVVSGSAFAYTYITMGELPAWIVGWNLDIKFMGGASSLSRGIASYMNGLLEKFGANLPEWMLGVKVFGVEECSIIAVVFLFLLTFIYTRGISESNAFNKIFTYLKLATLGVIIFIALLKFNSNNFEPFVLEE